LNNYRKGIAKFQLPDLKTGPHSIRIKAWDVLNNSSETILEFVVQNDEELVIDHVLNYPNPFTSKTQFWFEHNKPGQELMVQIQIFTLTGRVIKTLEKTINTPGNRSCDIEWDARDEFGDKIGRGIYLYKMRVQSNNSKPRIIIEKLVVL
jgi:flagellar hook assembly protein FlgD